MDSGNYTIFFLRTVALPPPFVASQPLALVQRLSDETLLVSALSSSLLYLLLFFVTLLLRASRRVEEVPQPSTWRNYCSESFRLKQDVVSRFIHSFTLGGAVDLLQIKIY